MPTSPPKPNPTDPTDPTDPAVHDSSDDPIFGGVPNDDESAQQGEIPDVVGPFSSGGVGVIPAEYIATDGDVQGEGRSTQDLKDRRVIDPDAPMDYAQLPDGPDTQGNKYPPGPKFYEAEAARAQIELDAAQAKLDEAAEALDAANAARDDNPVLDAPDVPGVSDVPEQSDDTVEAVTSNENFTS